MRIQSIDILRGIAILGILLMNIYFHPIITLDYVSALEIPLSDTIINIFNTIFFDGRFRTLFCILFGVGLSIQIKSCKNKGLNVKDFLKSRLNWLLIFGLIHGVFIFGGDILLLYSVCAFFIINKIQEDTRSIYKYAIRYLFIASTLLILSTILIFLSMDMQKDIITRGSFEYLQAYNLWFGNYSYQVMQQGITLAIIVLLSPFFGLLWQASGLMLLGSYLYKIRFFKYGFKGKKFNQILFLAVILTSFDVYLRLSYENLNSVFSLYSSIPAIFVALVYAHIVVKLVNKKTSFLNIFIPCGKLAFSLYIFQSIIMAILLRWVFPNFYLKAIMLDYLIVSIIFIVLQILLANMYFKYFNQGPLEYLWRKLYLKSFSKKK